MGTSPTSYYRLLRANISDTYHRVAYHTMQESIKSKRANPSYKPYPCQVIFRSLPASEIPRASRRRFCLREQSKRLYAHIQRVVIMCEGRLDNKSKNIISLYSLYHILFILSSIMTNVYKTKVMSTLKVGNTLKE